LERLFEWEGYTQITGLTDPRAALELCRFARPDILLLDLHMPQIDGYTFLERLGENYTGDDFMPVLVFTADVNEEAKKRALTLGATDFLRKPCDPTEMALRVHNFLKMRHLHREVVRQNEALESRVQERTADLEAARLDALRRLAKAAECRDDDTGEHIQRVGELAALIGAALQAGPSPAELRIAAPLHDIGKIGLPDSILLKPGKLTTEEFEAMKSHTTLGHEILSGGPSPILQLAASIALTHHERWDGSGYPGRLCGANIPIEGRVTAVADVFDALTRRRPYKAAWPLEEAVAEIRRGSGAHFDPEVVTAFLSLDLQEFCDRGEAAA